MWDIGLGGRETHIYLSAFASVITSFENSYITVQNHEESLQLPSFVP